MRRGFIFLLVFVLLLLGPTAVRYLNFYRLGGSERVAPPAFDAADAVNSVPTPASAAFVDDPEVLGGLVLLDQAHDNAFTLEEIGFLDGRLAARGVEMISYSGGDLATALRAVNAFVVITPLQPFSQEETQAVESFVRRGGRLLMLGDPTRYNVVVEEDSLTFNVFLETDKIPLNSLANAFDIIFNGDYLYNTTENEGNFRNIILNQVGFATSPLTDDLERLVMYGAHSLQVGAGAESLLAGDDNTWSSATDRPGGLTLAATGAQGRVLAVGDLQFLTEPYFTVFDNGRFIAHIADFLAEPIRRDFTVADFPYFFTENIHLIYTGSPELGPDAFDEIIRLQAGLQAAEKEIILTAAANRSGDAIFLGLFNQTAEVADLLEAAAIRLIIEPAILTEEEEAALNEENLPDKGATEEADEEFADQSEAEDSPAQENAAMADSGESTMRTRLIQSPLGNVQMSGTALILLDESDGQRTLVVLAASTMGLENTINRLLDTIPLDANDVLADCLLQDNVALCPTDIVDEQVEAELESGGQPDMPAEAGQEEDVEEQPEGSEEETASEIDAVDQGSIGLGETVEGSLPPGERYSWTFEEGPAVIDITVVSGEDLDAVLELYDSTNELLELSDSGFTGEEETITGAEIPANGVYTILLRDFFDDGGDFALSVTESEEPATGNGDEGNDGGETDPGEGESENGTSIFLFVDDNGEPISSGFTSQVEFETLLPDPYTVVTWVSSVDGPLDDDTLETTDLLIWDSGDYLEEDGVFDEDTNIIFGYVDSGRPLLITGSSPTLFGDIGLSSLTDVEFSGEDEILLAGFTAGEILELEGAFDVVTAGFLPEDLQSGSSAFLLHGPDSEEAGNIVGLASIDEFNNDQRTIILMLPFVGLPEEAQVTLLDNMLAWLGFTVP